jgi:hypothetical protein
MCKLSRSHDQAMNLACSLKSSFFLSFLKLIFYSLSFNIFFADNWASNFIDFFMRWYRSHLIFLCYQDRWDLLWIFRAYLFIIWASVHFFFIIHCQFFSFAFFIIILLNYLSLSNPFESMICISNFSCSFKNDIIIWVFFYVRKNLTCLAA